MQLGANFTSLDRFYYRAVFELKIRPRNTLTRQKSRRKSFRIRGIPAGLSLQGSSIPELKDRSAGNCFVAIRVLHPQKPPGRGSSLALSVRLPAGIGGCFGLGRDAGVAEQGDF
jgi:hypothetical protein